jgi:peptidoglycan hydrolase-like protein with peptidoglycan-binding domain
MPITLGSTAYLSMYDSAYPPAKPPVTDAVAVYIGGDTPHVWTPEEVAAQKARYVLPIFVRSNPAGADAAADAQAAVKQLKAIGMTGSLVAWDAETSVGSGYITEVSGYMLAAHYKLIVYGSISTVTGNKNPDGWYWDANWTGAAHLDPGDQATQYANEGSWDLSLLSYGLAGILWDRHPAPQPPSVMMGIAVRLPSLMRGDTDVNGAPFYIHRAQALIATIGASNNLPAAASLKADGVFGPLTQTAVRVLQGHWGIRPDGSIGSVEWRYLIQGSA